MTTRDCSECAKNAAAWAMGTLSGEEAGSFEQHLAMCRDCAALTHRLGLSVALLHEAAAEPAVRPPARIRERLIATLREGATGS